MPLNCEARDLAVVIADEPGCEANIGRIVRVLKPTTVSGCTQAWWSIQPVDRKPWTCIEPIQDGKWVEVYQNSGRVCIEDHCLRPIRDARTLAQTQAQQSLNASNQKSSATE